MSGLATGGSNKELTGRIREGPKGGRRCQLIICPANLPEALTLESILAKTFMCLQKNLKLDQLWAQTR